jgi:hypothetical protein
MHILFSFPCLSWPATSSSQARYYSVRQAPACSNLSCLAITSPLRIQKKCQYVGLVSFQQASFAYGRILYEIIAAGWTAFLLDDRSDRSRGAIEKYDAAWAEYRTLAATCEDCPAIYRDTSCWYLKNKGMIDHPGMGASIERMRQQVGKKIGHSH